MDAPIINEYKLTLECIVVEINETSLNETRVVGEIVNMSADESILDEEGNIDLGKLPSRHQLHPNSIAHTVYSHL